MAGFSGQIRLCDHTFAMTSPNTVSSKPRLVPCTTTPLSGLWCPETHLKGLFYGSGCVRSHLRSMLPSAAARVFIVTGTSLYNKTSLIQELEELLGENHAGTFAGIKQHGHFTDVDAAFTQLSAASSQQPVDTIISVGGGSPIDSAKTLSYWTQQASGNFLTHIAIPTTLSAAECTAGGGYTNNDGVKIGFMCSGCKFAKVSQSFFTQSCVFHETVRRWAGSNVSLRTNEMEPHRLLQTTNMGTQWVSRLYFMTQPLPDTRLLACCCPQVYVLWTMLWRLFTTQTRPKCRGRHWPPHPSRLFSNVCPQCTSRRYQPIRATQTPSHTWAPRVMMCSCA